MKVFKNFLMEELGNSKYPEQKQIRMPVVAPNTKVIEVNLDVYYNVEMTDERFDYEYGDIRGVEGKKPFPEVESLEFDVLDDTAKIVAQGGWNSEEDLNADIDSQLYSYLNQKILNNTKS